MYNELAAVPPGSSKLAKHDPQTMSNNYYLLLQASIICLPFSFAGTTA